MIVGNLYSAKELAQTAQPLLLCEFRFSDGTTYRASTHPLNDLQGGTPASGSYQYGGFPWDARVVNQDIGATQAMSDLGVDIVPQVTVVLADSDKTVYTSQEFDKGFRGATLTLYAVMFDAGDITTGAFSSNSPAPIKFIGTCGSASMDQGTLTVTATSLLNFASKQMPPQRIQQICSWAFPPDGRSRTAALSSPFSIFSNCGYSADVPGGVGNMDPNTGLPYTFCPFSRKACTDRLGDDTKPIPIQQDKNNNRTGRFGGYEWIPPTDSGKQRPYISGKWEEVINASNDARYGDYMRLCYGTTWVSPLVMGVWGDGNYTTLETAICSGKINEILKVLVNGIEVPQAHTDAITSDKIPSAVETSDYKNGYWVTVNNGKRNGQPYNGNGWKSQGDPYGSVAAIAIVVLAQVAAANTVPSVQILLRGAEIGIYTFDSVVTLNTAIDAVQTSFDLTVIEGTPTDGFSIPSKLEILSTGEIMLITGVAGSTVTVTRGYSGTTAQAALIDAKGGTYNFLGDFNYNVAYTSSPPWILRDVLLKAGWLDSNIDLHSFAVAATVCDVNINFDSMTGDYQNFYNESGNPPFKRFEVGFAVERRMSFGDLVRGIRAAMRGVLFFDFNTGLLTLGIKQTLGDQQPVPIVGSNYNVAVTSVDASGNEADGFVAYNFDFDSIIKDAQGRSSLTISQRSIQDTPNKTTLQFLNRENSYSQDSITVVDIEDVARTNQETTGSMPVMGVQTFDHARRILNNWLAENYRGNPRFDYLGSAIGDTGGTAVFDFHTSVKGVHLMVGQLCMITDEQAGIFSQLFRIIRIRPAINFETVQITGFWHNDNWYQDTFGQSEQPIYGPAQGVSSIPFSWRPGLAAPVDGDALYHPSDMGFDVYPVYSLSADNVGLGSLAVVGKIPVNSFPHALLKPRLELLGEGETGGSYPKSAAFYVTIAEKLTSGALAAAARAALVPLTGDEDALSFIVQAWPGQPTGYVAFAGLHPTAVSFQSEGTGTPRVIELINEYNEASWGPPDDAFSNFQFNVREIVHGGVFTEALPYDYSGDLVTTTSIKLSVFHNDGFGTLWTPERMTSWGIPGPDPWSGRILSVYGLSARDDGTGRGTLNLSTPIPIANFRVTGNDGDTLFIDPTSGDPTTCVDGGPLQSGDIVTLRLQPRFGSDGDGNYFEDPMIFNELNPLVDNFLIADVTNATPIRITLDLTDGSGFPFGNNDVVRVQGVLGCDAANGLFNAENVDSATASFDLIKPGTEGPSSGNGAYTGGGTVGHTSIGLSLTGLDNSDEERGDLVFIVAGTGRGTSVKIKKSSFLRAYIDGDWPIQPDATSILIIVAPDFLVSIPSPPINNSTREIVGTELVEMKNYDKISVLVQVATHSKAKRSSLISLDPFREIFMVGNPFNSGGTPGGAPFTVRAEGYAMLTVNDLHMSQDVFAINEMNFLVPSVDETDCGLWGELTMDATTDPITLTFSRSCSRSRYGTQFRAGDFVVVNDPGSGGVTKYECCQIVSVNLDGSVTLNRQDPLANPGMAFFGSRMSAHSAKKAYRLIPRVFSQAIKKNTYGTLAPSSISGLPEKWEWAWANKCVVGVVSQAIGDLGNGPIHKVNLGINSLVQNSTVPCPGLRTMNGGAYISLGISGQLGVGQSADKRAPVIAWESIRSVSATLRSNAVGNVVVHVVYITPDMSQVGLVDTVVIESGQLTNYMHGGVIAQADLPQSRQMPYYAANRIIDAWPPQIFPVCSGMLDGNKNLQLPLTLVDAVCGNVLLAPDGWLDLIVEEAGSGVDLSVSVLT